MNDPRVWHDIDGYSDNPAGGDGARGARYLDAVVGAVAAALQEFHSRTGREGDTG